MNQYKVTGRFVVGSSTITLEADYIYAASRAVAVYIGALKFQELGFPKGWIPEEIKAEVTAYEGEDE